MRYTTGTIDGRLQSFFTLKSRLNVFKEKAEKMAQWYNNCPLSIAGYRLEIRLVGIPLSDGVCY